MQDKDINLFNEAIHKAKFLVRQITEQRKQLDDDVKELQDIISELYELFEDLSDGEGK